jgi:hypothetical protein
MHDTSKRTLRIKQERRKEHRVMSGTLAEASFGVGVSEEHGNSST